MRDGPEESKQGDEEEDQGPNVALSHVNPDYFVVAFSNSARFEIRKLQSFQGIRSSILLLPLNFLVFCQRPYNLLETSHMTSHTSLNRFIHILYLSSLGAI